jgi:hypothetical protein
VFIPVWSIAPEGTRPQTSAFPYVFGAFIGMIAGILVGALGEVPLKRIFTPWYRRLLVKRRMDGILCLPGRRGLELPFHPIHKSEENSEIDY